VGFSRRALALALLVVTAIAVSLVAAEAVARILYPPAYYMWPPKLKYIFRPLEGVMPGVSGESRFEANSRGLRADELHPHHTHRILAIGGSTTECIYLDQSEAWPHLLQEHLSLLQPGRIWVGNAGRSGQTTRQHLVAKEHLPLRDWKIDTVILLIGGNDLSRRLSQNGHYDPFHLERPGARQALMDETFAKTGRVLSEDKFLKRTALWQLMRNAKKNLSPAQVQPNVHQDEAGRVYETWRENRRKASEIRTELPDLTSALNEYERNVNRLIDLARERGIRLILVTQPAMWSHDLSAELEALLWFGGIGDFQRETGVPYYSPAALAKGLRAYNERLLQICRSRGAECVDLASMLEKDTTVFYDDLHFNEHGARKVAAVLASYLASEHPPISPPLAAPPRKPAWH